MIAAQAVSSTNILADSKAPPPLGVDGKRSGSSTLTIQPARHLRHSALSMARSPSGPKLSPHRHRRSHRRSHRHGHRGSHGRQLTQNEVELGSTASGRYMLVGIIPSPSPPLPSNERNLPVVSINPAAGSSDSLRRYSVQGIESMQDIQSLDETNDDRSSSTYTNDGQTGTPNGSFHGSAGHASLHSLHVSFSAEGTGFLQAGPDSASLSSFWQGEEEAPLLPVRVVKVANSADEEIAGCIGRRLARIDKCIWLLALLILIVGGVIAIILSTNSFGPPPL